MRVIVSMLGIIIVLIYVSVSFAAWNKWSISYEKEKINNYLKICIEAGISLPKCKYNYLRGE